MAGTDDHVLAIEAIVLRAGDWSGIEVFAAGRVLEDIPPRDLKPLADELKRQVGSGVVALVSVTEGKASIVVGVTDDLTASFGITAVFIV